MPETATPLDVSNLACYFRVPANNASVLLGFSRKSFLMYDAVIASTQAERFSIQPSVLLIAVYSGVVADSEERDKR